MWVTPYDRDGFRWRIEIMPDGRVQVYRLSDDWVSNAPRRDVRDIGALGLWLHEQGIDPDDLTPG